MIDERFEVQEYLNGKSIVLGNLYRICWLIVRWYKEQGLNRLDIRNEVFKWGCEQKITIKYNVNDIINKVYDKEMDAKLRSPAVKINKQDVQEIDRRFDNKKTKLCALAILCYAKAYADRAGTFNISTVNLSAWVGINRKSLANKYIKELIDFEYLTLVSLPPKIGRWKDMSYYDQATTYKLNVPCHNSGNFVLRNNAIRILFSEVYCPQEGN